MGETRADLFGGLMGGAAGVFVGQPLDVVIVRMQTSAARFPSTWACVQQIYRAEGFRSFYRGILPPMLSYGTINALLFSTFGFTSRFLQQLTADPKAVQPSLPVVFASGVVAGAVCSLIIGPVELLKCRAQIALEGSALKETNPLHCARAIVAARGLSGLFIGTRATIMRDAPGFGFYFLTYEFLCKCFGIQDSVPASAVSFEALAKINVAGGIAGVLAWLPTHPLDLIKARIQTQSLTKPLYRGVWDCGRQMHAQEGVRGLFRGLAPTLVQAGPVAAVTFLVYELTLLAFIPANTPAAIIPPAPHIR
eukprot:m.118356 g.118356  ORF g.118356 m.118356 type:complete len:308 (+) comp52011_c0_seq1:208-1131(+)